MNHPNKNTGDFHKLPTIEDLINLIKKSGITLEQAKKESFMLKVLGGTSFTVNLLYVYSQVLQQLNALNYPEEVKSKAFWAWFKEIEDAVDILTGVDQGMWKVTKIDESANKLTFE